jgi:hypothetical protein
VKDLYNENYKTLKKEIGEYTRRWQDLLCLWVGELILWKMAILPKAINTFSAMPTKISVHSL